jgi:hypothetical protein
VSDESAGVAVTNVVELDDNVFICVDVEGDGVVASVCFVRIRLDLLTRCLPASLSSLSLSESVSMCGNGCLSGVDAFRFIGSAVPVVCEDFTLDEILALSSCGRVRTSIGRESPCIRGSLCCSFGCAQSCLDGGWCCLCGCCCFCGCCCCCCCCCDDFVIFLECGTGEPSDSTADSAATRHKQHYIMNGVAE